MADGAVNREGHAGVHRQDSILPQSAASMVVVHQCPAGGPIPPSAGGPIPPSADCPVCREPPITEVVLDEATNRFIVSETEAHPSVETGGILVGYVDEKRRAVITRATGPGPKAVRTAVRFQRDMDYVQNELDRAAKELGQKGSYQGERHSHLEPTPEPSASG